METSQSSIAQRSQEKLYFDHPDMDYYFSWIVGRQIYAGSDMRECREVASPIVNGDSESWCSAWGRLAEQVEAQAQAAHDSNNLMTARAAYMRACTYYRAPLFIMKPQNSAFRDHWRKMRSCFQKAAALADPPIERIEVPFQGRLLAGYFWKTVSQELPRSGGVGRV